MKPVHYSQEARQSPEHAVQVARNFYEQILAGWLLLGDTALDEQPSEKLIFAAQYARARIVYEDDLDTPDTESKFIIEVTWLLASRGMGSYWLQALKALPSRETFDAVRSGHAF